jgi:hypothetical protein
MTYLDPILQLDLATGVHRDVLERLACAIVRFAAALEGLQYGSLVYAPRDVGVEGAGAARGRRHYIMIDPRVRADTHLKRLMRSNISPCETSGYFFCRRMDCIVCEGGRDWVECGMKGSVEIAG